MPRSSEWRLLCLGAGQAQAELVNPEKSLTATSGMDGRGGASAVSAMPDRTQDPNLS